VKLPVLGDAVRIVRGRPVLLVGVGVAAFAGYRLLAGQGEAGDATTAEDATTAGDGYGSMLSGALGLSLIHI